MRKSRVPAWLVLLLTMMLLGAACGGSDEPSGEETDGEQAAGNCDPSTLTPAAAGAAASPAASAAASPSTSAAASPSASAAASPSASASDSASVAYRLAQAKPTVTIGAFGDRTGGNSQLIIPGHEAMKLAVDQANAKGDLPVTIAFKPIDNRDGKGDPAIPIAQQLIDDKTVVGVLGGGFSAEVASTGGLFDEAGLLNFTSVATRPDLTEQGWKTFFRGVANDNDQGAAIIKVLDALGCSKVALVDDKTAYGQGLGDVAEREAGAAGMDVVLNEGIEPTEDYTSLVDSVLAADPQALFYAGYAKDFAPMTRQLREKGYEGIISSGDGSKVDSIGTDIGAEDAENVVLTCPCPDINLSKDPLAVQFVKDYKAAYGGKAPGIYAAEGYDVANVTIDAIRTCGADGAAAITRKCVVDKVRASDYQGVTKKFEFADNGQVETGDVSVFVVRDGKVAEIGLAGSIK